MKALADRFHRPGGVDLWNDRDGPRVFAAPDTGRASARFFPKGSVHSIQPYGLVNGGPESTLAARGNPADATDRSHRHRLQGVRENAAKKEMRGVGGYREPAVEYIERGGVWEPVSNLDRGGDNNSSDSGWNDDNVISDLEDIADVDFRPEQRAMDGRDRRKVVWQGGKLQPLWPSVATILGISVAMASLWNQKAQVNIILVKAGKTEIAGVEENVLQGEGRP